MTDTPPARPWRETLRGLADRRVLAMLFLGFSAGVPLLLIFGTLSLWLREAGIERAAVTMFSWAALGYSFKFVWAPLVDRLPVPVLTRRLGRRRGWLLVAQLAIIGAILWMAHTDPVAGPDNLTLMALGAILLGFSAATQDIVIDAYRIESAPPDLQALLSATYIAGYRVGMLTAGAGALFLASHLGSDAQVYHYEAWRWTYTCLAAVMGIGVLTTLAVAEPKQQRAALGVHATRDYLGFLGVFALAAASFAGAFFISADLASVLKGWLALGLGGVAAAFLVEALRLAGAIASAVLVANLLVRLGAVDRGILRETYVAPVRDFFQRYGKSTALLLLALVGVYRIADIVLGVIANVFYQDMGFSKPEIATIVNTFGLFMTLAGGFLGGLLSARYGVLRILLLGALLAAATNLLFVLLALRGHDLFTLYLVISADNLSAGLASAAFVAFLSSLTNVSFTAVQYAIFSSLMTLLPKLLGGYSGSLVEQLGYPGFFLLTTALGIPVLWLAWRAGRLLKPPADLADKA